MKGRWGAVRVCTTPLPPLTVSTAPMSETREIIDDLKKRHVRFLLLQFTDLLGVNKAVEVPASQFDKALAGEGSFDGSGRERFSRVGEADVLAVPDLAPVRGFPGESGEPG